MVIKRDYYLGQLINAKHNGMIKVITGLRRSGKSFLLFELFDKHLTDAGVDSEHIIKFAFDSQDYLDLIGEDLLELNLKKRKVDPVKFNNYIKSKIVDDKTYYILLDEIQLLDSFEAVLNGYLRKSNLDVYVTGSNAKFLSKDVITEFRGRGWQIHVNPLSFKEYFEASDKSKEEAYNEYAVYGGLPKLFDFTSETDKVKYLNSIFEETYLKDKEFLSNTKEVFRIVGLKRKEELVRKGGVAADMKVADFAYFTAIKTNKEFKVKFNEMQKIYVFDKNDELTTDEALKAVGELQRVMKAIDC